MMSQPINPYESPREANSPAPISARRELITRLRGPSIGLLVLSGMQAGYTLFCLIMVAAMFMMFPSRVFAFWWKLEEFAALIVAFVPSAFIFTGAWQMRRMRSLYWCRAAAIAACIPFLSPAIFVGIPLGIWAAIVLFQRATAEEFRRQPTGE